MSDSNISRPLDSPNVVRWRRARGYVRIGVVVIVVWSLLAWVAAEALITQAEIEHADAIVVLSNASAYVERTRLAAKLWKEGRAPRVIITNENLKGGWSEAEQRNPFFTERATNELKRAGVPEDRIVVLPTIVSSTVDEAVLLKRYAAENNLRSLLVVTSAYHSRRSLWTFREVFAGTGVSIGLDAVAPGHQSPGPAAWWIRPSGWRFVALEYPKLAYNWFRLRSTRANSPGILD